MKHVLVVLFFLPTQVSFSQANDTSEKQVSFTTTIDISMATKDGIYLNGYVVNMNYEQIKKLDGKKVKLSGKVTIVKGLENLPKTYDEQGREIIRGGRQSDTKHIQSPKIEVIEN